MKKSRKTVARKNHPDKRKADAETREELDLEAGEEVEVIGDNMTAVRRQIMIAYTARRLPEKNKKRKKRKRQ